MFMPSRGWGLNLVLNYLNYILVALSGLRREVMKAEYKKSYFNRIISRVFVLVVFFSILMVPWSALASPQKDEPISRGEFIAMMANSQPENPLFPKGHSQLSNEELYFQTTQNLSWKGFKVLNGKPSHEPLESNEFIQLTYAFTEGTSGENLFEQKLYLKNAGIINSADVGLTTAYDGKVYQTHQEENVANPVRLATPIYMHDHLETDLAAKATFTFDDRSTLTLAEGSTVNITKHIYNPDTDLRQTIIHLSKGTVRFVVTKGKARGSMFKVITPTATAGVRGTEFIVNVAPDGETTFLVVEGEIETSILLPLGKEGAMRLVAAGESRSISKSNTATEVKKITPAILQSILKRTENPKKQLVKKGLSKAVARKGAKAAAMTMAKIKTKQGSNNSFTAAIVKNAAQAAVQHATQAAVQHATQEAVQHATQEAVQHATQEAVQHATQEAVQEVVQHATQEAVQHATQEAVQEVVQDATQEAVQNATQEAVLATIRNAQILGGLPGIGPPGP